MAAKAVKQWKPGTDLPYVIPIGQDGMLAILLRAEWVKSDPSGEPLLLPPAVRVIDRLRALFAKQDSITPGFVVSLREALGLTQQQFGERLGVSKMTVSRWECGRMKPRPTMHAAMHSLRSRASREGTRIDGARRT